MHQRLTRPVLVVALTLLTAACDIPDRVQSSEASRRLDATTATPPTGRPDSETGAPDTAPFTGCLGDADCGHIDGCCLTGACISGTCVARAKPDCCSVPGPCASYTTQHNATCEAVCVPGGCEQTLKLSDTRCGDTLWTLALDVEGLNGLVFDDPIPTDRIGWRLSTRHGLGDAAALFAGDAVCPTYYNGPLDQACQPIGDVTGDLGNSVHLAFDTPPIVLAEDRPAVAEIWLWLDLEAQGDTSASNRFDGVEIAAVSPEGIIYPRWSSRLHPAPARRWFPILIDFSELAGRAARVRIAFDTIDGRDNLHEGVYVGGIRVFTPCPADRSCATPGACQANYPTTISPTADLLCLQASVTPEVACTPCTTADTCPTTDPCDTATCDTGRCTLDHTLTAACCTPQIAGPAPPSFEADLGDSWINATADAASHWHRSEVRARAGTASLRFANPATQTLAAPGEAGDGVIWSPPLVVPPDDPALFFYVYLSTEWDDAPRTDNPAGIDLLEALIRVEDGPALTMSLPAAVLWDSRALGGTTQGTWEPVTLPLSTLVGRTIRLGWRFQTGDPDANTGEGAFIDDVIVYRRCPGCESPDSCGQLER